MIEFIQNNVEFLIFIALLSLFLYIKRNNLAVIGSFPLLYMLQYKTTWGLRQMDAWAKKQPRFWKYVAYVSVGLGIVGTIVMIPFMIWQLMFIFDQGLDSGGGLVLPINTGEEQDLTNPSGLIFYVPFWYWIVAILFIATVHEFGHGVIAERFKVKIKSSGFAFAGIIAPILPAAFVEPDMEDLGKKPHWQQIAVLGAGPLANVFFAAVFLLIIVGVGMYANTVYEDQGVSFQNVSSISPLNNVTNLDSGIINTLYVGNETYKGQEIFTYFMTNLTNSTELILTLSDTDMNQTSNVSFIPVYDVEQERAVVGINGVALERVPMSGKEMQASLIEGSSEWLFWLFLLNFGIGIMNLLPLWITDGGQITRVMLNKYMSEERAMIGVHLISFISLILIIVTISPSLIPFVG
ncbi:MAG: site-2 protease family protein [Candidatus Nanoarchaeia archaeon]